MEQSGNPSALYERPATQFVASFLGESNFIRGEVSDVQSDRFRYTVQDRSFLQAGSPGAKQTMMARFCWLCVPKK